MNILSIIISGIIIYIICRYLFNRYWDRGLSVELKFSQSQVYAGEKLSLNEIVTNRKVLPIPLLLIKFTTDRNLKFLDTETDPDNTEEAAASKAGKGQVTDKYYRTDVVSLGMYQRVTRKLDICAKKRGVFYIDGCSLVYHDLIFGIKNVKGFNNDLTLFVYPRMTLKGRFSYSYNDLIGDIITRRFINEDPFEFRGIRDYRISDSMKSINWKASARGTGLKVNEKNFTSSLSVTILLNLESRTMNRNIEIEEASISLCARFVNDLIKQGIGTSFISNAADVRNGRNVSLEYGNGDSHILNALRCLATIDAGKITCDFNDMLKNYARTRSSSDYCIIISTRTSKEIRDTVNYVIRQGYNFIIPYSKYDKLTKTDTSIGKCSAWYVED